MGEIPGQMSIDDVLGGLEEATEKTAEEDLHELGREMYAR